MKNTTKIIKDTIGREIAHLKGFTIDEDRVEFHVETPTKTFCFSRKEEAIRFAESNNTVVQEKITLGSIS